MKNNQGCIHGGISPKSLLVSLHKNQGGPGRHKCPTCAYEQGFIIGSSRAWNSYTAYCNTLIDTNKCPRGSVAPKAILTTIGENQGGVGRHKCTNCAFKQGFEEGLLATSNKAFTLELVVAPVRDTSQNHSKSSQTVIDYAKREANNRELGLLGEELIYKKEK